METKLKKGVIIGGGPAGLTAAQELLKSENFEVKILDQNSKVGGLSRTTEYKGCKFDIGPHHFITQSEKIAKYWKNLMQEEEKKGNYFVQLSRFTRIYYNKHFFHYPLQPLNVFKGLSFFECFRCFLSYLKICLFPIKKVKSFQDWVTNKFGYRLFSIFFKTYTEKLWGISCKKISSDWAAQRIKGFSLSKAIFYAFFGRWFKKNAPRTLCDKFHYPVFGAGTLWEKLANSIRENDFGRINLNEEVVSIKHENGRIISVFSRGTKGSKSGAQQLKEYCADYFFSTMPIKSLILSLNPLPEEKIIKAAEKLCYRGLITVNLIVNKKDICPDHWLYIHEKEVKMVRIGNMNNFSLRMVGDGEHTALGIEYFSFVDKGLWNKTDEQFIQLGKKELAKIGLAKSQKVLDGMVLREPQAYPVYDKYYQKSLKIVLDYLSKFYNLRLMGRNGLHKYNNMDIAMLSAMDATDKVIEREKVNLQKGIMQEPIVNEKIKDLAL